VDSSDSKLKILKLAFLFEGFLALIYIIDQIYNGHSLIPSIPTIKELVFGVLLSQLLFIFNKILVRLSFKNDWKIFKDFISNMILPIASKMDTMSAFLISLAAGIGEELFFRGFLQVKFGIIFSSVLFGLVHFLFDIRKFLPIVLLYIFIGFIFGFTYELFGTLWVPVIFHCFYDFAALLYFKREIDKGKIF
jgi:membrane protease YdiL (CAAX protease family)